ncbi:MAG: hypothetical protein IJQ78_03095, partial [Selenomonadaceae bacterium]|nr:hypothetical protein [Selenomonadaceae bacterium]
LAPIHPQGVPLHDVGIAFEGQEINVHLHDVFHLLQGLAPRYPVRQNTGISFFLSKSLRQWR